MDCDGRAGSTQASARLSSSVLMEIRLPAPLFSGHERVCIYDLRSDYEEISAAIVSRYISRKNSVFAHPHSNGYSIVVVSEKGGQPVADVASIQKLFGLTIERRPQVSEEDSIYNYINTMLLFRIYDHLLSSGYERFLMTSNSSGFDTWGVLQSSPVRDGSGANVQYRKAIALLNCTNVNNGYEVFLLKVLTAVYKVSTDDVDNADKILLPSMKAVTVIDTFMLKEGDSSAVVEQKMMIKKSSAAADGYLNYVPTTLERMVTYHLYADGVHLLPQTASQPSTKAGVITDSAALNVSLLQSVYRYEELMDGDNNFIDNKSSRRDYYEKDIKPSQMVVSYCTEDRKRSSEEVETIASSLISTMKKSKCLETAEIRILPPKPKIVVGGTTNPARFHFQTARSLKPTAPRPPAAAASGVPEDLLFCDMGAAFGQLTQGPPTKPEPQRAENITQPIKGVAAARAPRGQPLKKRPRR